MKTLYRSNDLRHVGRRATFFLVLFTAVLICVVRNQQALGQWSHDPAANTPISTAADDQSSAVITSDGSGGAIIAWHDRRNGAHYDIYAQRINATGIVQWTPNGVPISTAANYQYYPTITNDGAGGAIITWYDVRGGINEDIYAQRVNSAGVRQWIVSGDSNGAAISLAGNDQSNPTITSDGSGGAIITWTDNRSGNSDIYAQRINASGVVQWTAYGAAISQASGIQNNPIITSDGSGGAIITWVDYRGSASDIYAQRINAGGAVQWTGNGVPICTAADYQYNSTITSDGSGGAIITWYDNRSGNYDIYAQRINSGGVVQWTGDGVPISTAASGQSAPTITSDGAGGA